MNGEPLILAALAAPGVMVWLLLGRRRARKARERYAQQLRQQITSGNVRNPELLVSAAAEYLRSQIRTASRGAAQFAATSAAAALLDTADNIALARKGGRR